MRFDLEGMRVAVLATDGFEQVEVTGPVDALRGHGAEVDIVSLHPGRIRGVNSLHPGRKLRVDRTVFTAGADDYDAVLLPGGLIGPDTLRQSERALDFVRAAERDGKPIAFICHAPWILISAGLLVRRNLTSWPGIRDDIRNAGGRWHDEPVVRDGNWVSSRGPHDLAAFNRAMLELFAEHAPAVPRRPRYAAGQAKRGGGWLGALVGVLALAGAVYAAARRRGERGGTSDFVEVVDLDDDERRVNAVVREGIAHRVAEPASGAAGGGGLRPRME